ncbi:MAG: phosphatase PAP2 family protein [Oscillospiraceae bacterium]|nr:phosphatase PAP2 family protein [Oscillospiraceae bacterium]
MELLYILESVRTPVLNSIMYGITCLGDEVLFMAFALTIYWCVSKRQGYYIFATGMLGTLVNQGMKLWFHIPRPWLLDPDFTIVEAARAGAEGFSFPSGHTQNAVGTFGAVFICNKQKWLRILCLAAIILVPFSRMYLGVHTPMDVGVAFAIAVFFLILLYPVFKNDERSEKYAPYVLVFLIVAAVVYLVYVFGHPFAQDVYNDPDSNLQHGIHNGFSMLGAMLGFLAAYFFDSRVTNFDVKAPLIGQILKVALGLGLIIAVKGVLKTPLLALFNGSELATALRYFLMVVFGGCIWPMTFPFFAKLGRRRSEKV